MLWRASSRNTKVSVRTEQKPAGSTSRSPRTAAGGRVAPGSAPSVAVSIFFFTAKRAPS
jgi:hypothetical protein